jgi:DNA-binding transcriptional MerR regulator
MSETGSSASGETTPAALRPAEVAERLGISAATLRRWSSRFGDFLELGEGGQDGGTHRRYSAADVATLARVQQLLEQGWTYEQVADRLSQGPADVAPGETRGESVPAGSFDAEPGLSPETAMVSTAASFDDSTDLSAEALSPAARFLRDAMQAVTGNQQIILNSQQASRDMLGVMIQDNLNLKSENTSLRERMLELERELAELHRHFVDTRERTEIRMRVLEDAIAKLMMGQPPASRSGTPPSQRPGMPPAPPPQQAYAPQAAPQSYPPQGYTPQTMPSQSYPPPGYTSQTMAPSPYPPQPYADQPPPKRGFWSRLLGG